MNPRFLLLLFTLLSTAKATCRPRFALTETFCANVPTARVDGEAFSGTWFQIFLTTETSTEQLNKCTTINYTLSDGSFEALNCEYDDFLTRPRCLIDSVTRRPGGGPGSFIATSGPASVPFDIVSLLGSRSYGYFAAAAFICNRGTTPTPGYFVLSRKPFLQKVTLKRLRKRLRCLGFPLSDRDDFRLTQVKDCIYFFNDDGFDLLDPADFFNP